MIQLSAVMWAGALFFAFIGIGRTVSKEMISLSGIILGLFFLHQFDNQIRGVLLGNLPPDQKFYVQAAIFLVIVFFAYQTRALVGMEATRARSNVNPEGRDTLQGNVLGGIVGFINGYLIMGTLWYFLDINRLPNSQYPLDPYVVAPPAGSPSAEAVASLPLYVLAGGPSGSGDLLALAVIVLFLIVLVVI